MLYSWIILIHVWSILFQVQCTVLGRNMYIFPFMGWNGHCSHSINDILVGICYTLNLLAHRCILNLYWRFMHVSMIRSQGYSMQRKKKLWVYTFTCSLCVLGLRIWWFSGELRSWQESSLRCPPFVNIEAGSLLQHTVPSLGWFSRHLWWVLQCCFGRLLFLLG